MTRSTARASRKPKGERDAQARATLVFRDFVRQLEKLGARYTEQRVVQHGKVIMAAGVSAGIDMALTLAAQIAGEDIAQAIQLYIEYDPQPPFDSGSPSKAPERVMALASGRAAGR